MRELGFRSVGPYTHTNVHIHAFLNRRRFMQREPSPFFPASSPKKSSFRSDNREQRKFGVRSCEQGEVVVESLQQKQKLSAEPPSAPMYPESRVNKTVIKLSWRRPAEDGGRTDIRYQ